MKKLLILSLVFFTMQACFAQITDAGLDRLERRLFNDTYSSDSNQNRIERLERKLFGAEQTGDINGRYLTLKNAVKNYKGYNPYGADYYDGKTYCGSYPSYQPPLFTYGQGSSWRRTMWNNFRNFAGGVPTGITPAMDPAYMDWFEADRAMKKQYSQDNYGYRYSNTNNGSGMGVSILD